MPNPAIRPAILEAFRAAQFDPGAKRWIELFAGGFYWSDENWSAILRAREGNDILIQRCIVAYRASLSLGKPRERMRPFWEHLRTLAPTWPGFRPERCSPDLGPALTADLEAEYAAWEPVA